MEIQKPRGHLKRNFFHTFHFNKNYQSADRIEEPQQPTINQRGVQFSEFIMNISDYFCRWQKMKSNDPKLKRSELTFSKLQ